ncbi:hypothetical protein I3843_09G058600 [Carya illinoinensis]|nr:hypothetical protein I3843_09G058600 [Carya illinoinensis]
MERCGKNASFSYLIRVNFASKSFRLGGVKDPVLKGRKWSAYFDRSPGAAVNSEEFFHACVSGCGYKFDIPTEKVDEVRSNRPPKPPPLPKPTQPPVGPSTTTEDVTSTSA